MALPKQIKATVLSAALIGSAAIAAHFVMPFEGETFKSYKDGGGVWTICRGHTDGIKEGMTATKEQCDEWYKQDINYAQSVYDALVKTNNPANTKAAAISFIFNTGAGKFSTSTLRRDLNKGNVADACNQFPRWHYLDGRDCAVKANNCYGLVVRRQKERELCLDKNNYNSYSLGTDNVFRGVQGSQSH